MILDINMYKNDPRKERKNDFDYILPPYWTEDELNEWFKCKVDMKYFIKNYVYIFNESKGRREKLIDTIYKPQEEIVNELFKVRKMVILKSRQTGITSIMVQIMMWLILFHSAYKIGILSYSGPAQTDVITKKMNVQLKYLPPIFLKPVTTCNKQELIFDDGDNEISYIKAAQPGPSSQPFSGDTLNFLFMDEQAKIRFIETNLKSFLPTMATVIGQSEARQKKRPQGIQVVSTPNGIQGVGQWFYNLWKSSREEQQETSLIEEEKTEGTMTDSEFELGTNKDLTYKGYYPKLIHWRDCGFNDNWYNDQKELLSNDKQKIQQELDCQFIGSQETYFDIDLLTDIIWEKPKEVNIYWTRKREGEEIENYQTLDVWDEPISDIQYVIGVDISTGTQREKQQISVINGITAVQTQEWAGKMNTVDLQYFLYEVQKYYNNAILSIERNEGYHLIDKLAEELNYNNFFYDTDQKRGLYVKASNRAIIIDMIKTLLPDYDQINYRFIRSKNLLEELFSFEKKIGGRIEHKSGGFDDRIFQFQYQLYAREYVMDKIIKSSDLSKIKQIQQGQSIKHEYELMKMLEGIKETTGVTKEKLSKSPAAEKMKDFRKVVKQYEENDNLDPESIIDILRGN